MTKSLYLDSYHSFILCLTYTTRQINTEFSEDFKWTEFMCTLHLGVFALKNQLKFYIAQENFISGFSRNEIAINKPQLFLSVTSRRFYVNKMLL